MYEIRLLRENKTRNRLFILMGEKITTTQFALLNKQFNIGKILLTVVDCMIYLRYYYR